MRRAAAPRAGSAGRRHDVDCVDLGADSDVFGQVGGDQVSRALGGGERCVGGGEGAALVGPARLRRRRAIRGGRRPGRPPGGPPCRRRRGRPLRARRRSGLPPGRGRLASGGRRALLWPRGWRGLRRARSALRTGPAGRLSCRSSSSGRARRRAAGRRRTRAASCRGGSPRCARTLALRPGSLRLRSPRRRRGRRRRRRSR